MTKRREPLKREIVERASPVIRVRRPGGVAEVKRAWMGAEHPLLREEMEVWTRALGNGPSGTGFASSARWWFIWMRVRPEFRSGSLLAGQCLGIAPGDASPWQRRLAALRPPLWMQGEFGGIPGYAIRPPVGFKDLPGVEAREGAVAKWEGFHFCFVDGLWRQVHGRPLVGGEMEVLLMPGLSAEAVRLWFLLRRLPRGTSLRAIARMLGHYFDANALHRHLRYLEQLGLWWGGMQDKDSGGTLLPGEVPYV